MFVGIKENKSADLADYLSYLERIELFFPFLSKFKIYRLKPFFLVFRFSFGSLLDLQLFCFYAISCRDQLFELRLLEKLLDLRVQTIKHCRSSVLVAVVIILRVVHN
jgi:hypothetical protein